MKNIILILLFSVCSATTLAETIWLDVRSSSEFNADHMEDSIHIPHTKIKELAKTKLTNKQATINVYCVAGVRAGKAKSILEDLGYENVVNVISLKKARELKP